MDKTGLHHDERVAVFFGFVAAMAAFAPLAAEESYGRGAIILTFHEKRAERRKPQGFTVVEEKGLTRWQNYKERDPLDNPGGKKVYELTDGDRARIMAKKRAEPEPAVARAENKAR